jgi:hypothetical protein
MTVGIRGAHVMAHSPDPSKFEIRPLRGTVPTDPRYEIVFEESLFRRAPAARLLSKLVSMAGRVGEAIGDGYARAVGLVLRGVEHIEDSSAERRLRRRRSPPGDRARAPAGVTPKQPLSLQK